MLEFLILGILTGEDATGYELKKQIETTFGVFYKASFGSLYPALKRLAQKNCVTAYEAPRGARPRTVYHITDEGKTRFHEWLTAPMQVLDGTNPNLAKVYFFDRLPADERQSQLLEYEQNNLAYLRRLESLEQQFQAMGTAEEVYYRLSTLYYGIRVTRDTIAWCRHIREKEPLPAFIAIDEEVPHA